MQIQLAGGVEVDIATRDDLRQMEDRLAKKSGLPILARRIYQSITIPGGLAGSFLIEVDHPATPVVWDLRSLIVLGSDDHTALSGVTAAVYVGAPGVAGQPLSLLNCAWQGLAIPSSTSWNEQIIVSQNERLLVLLEGTNTNTLYTVNGLVIEVPKDFLQQYLS